MLHIFNTLGELQSHSDSHEYTIIDNYISATGNGRHLHPIMTPAILHKSNCKYKLWGIPQNVSKIDKSSIIDVHLKFKNPEIIIKKFKECYKSIDPSRLIFGCKYCCEPYSYKRLYGYSRNYSDKDCITIHVKIVWLTRCCHTVKFLRLPAKEKQQLMQKDFNVMGNFFDFDDALNYTVNELKGRFKNWTFCDYCMESRYQNMEHIVLDDGSIRSIDPHDLNQDY